jgi:hypothetical protein
MSCMSHPKPWGCYLSRGGEMTLHLSVLLWPSEDGKVLEVAMLWSERRAWGFMFPWGNRPEGSDLEVLSQTLGKRGKKYKVPCLRVYCFRAPNCGDLLRLWHPHKVASLLGSRPFLFCFHHLFSFNCLAKRQCQRNNLREIVSVPFRSFYVY